MNLKSVAFLTLTLTIPVTVFFLIKQKSNIDENNFAKIEEQKARFQRERAMYAFDMVKDPATGKIPGGIYEAEMVQARSIPLRVSGNTGQASRLTALNTYHPGGPNNIGGRTRALAYDIRYNGTTNRVIISGCVSGGIMRSTDGGANWTRVSPEGAIHNLNVVKQDPRTGFQDTWYAGTGEAWGNTAGENGAFYIGFGMYKSTDNGVTWTRLTGGGVQEMFDNVFDIIFNIAINPVNGDVYAAVLGNLFKSTNGGTNFTQVFQGSLNGNTENFQTDIVCSSTGKLFFAVNGGSTGGAAKRGVWTSVTGDTDSWTRIAGGSVLNVDSVANWRGNVYNDANASKRILMTLAPSNQNILFILYENGLSNVAPDNAPEADLFKLDMTSGNNWTNLSANMPDFPGNHAATDPFAIQGGYDLFITVKPNDPNFVILGGTSLYRSTDGFTSTANTSWIGGYGNTLPTLSFHPGSHPDIHNLVFNPSNANEALCSNDGGIQVTPNINASGSTVSWTMVTNYQTLQYYHVSMDPGAGRNNFIGGAQDNGTHFRDKMQLLGTAASDSNNQIRFVGGDGGYTGMGPLSASEQFLYATFQLGNLRRLKLSANPATDNITPDNLTPNSGTTGEYGEFVTNIRLNPENTSDLYYVNFNRLLRTTNATEVTSSTWTELSAVSTAIDNNGSTGGFNSIRAIGFSRGPYTTSHVLYLGTTNGKIYRVNDPRNATAITTPIDITPPLPAGQTTLGNVQDIAVNPNNDDEMMAVVSNYGVISVWWTNNAKAGTPTWRNAEGNLTLPSFRSCMIVVKKDAANNPVTEYYVGTSVGLYSVIGLGTTLLANASPTWQREGGNILNFAVIQSMGYRPGDNVLLLGTHGNGMYYTFIGTPNFTPNLNTGINDPVTNDKNFIHSLYPNITANQVNYRIGNMFNIKKISVQLFSLTGQQLWQKESGYQHGSVDISRYPGGAYILVIFSDDRRYRHVQRIVKQ